MEKNVKMIKLSICIPTYNRKQFLKEALNSIVEQITDEIVKKIEIVISDNDSNDGTEEFIKNYIKKTRVKIIYHKNKKNLGADLNYLKSVELANGEYCWIFGSDDLLNEESLKKVYSNLKNKHDVYLYNRINCDYDMNKLNKCFWLDEIIEDTLFNFKNKYEFSFYLKHSKSLGALFSYLSSIIFKKSKWDKVKYDDKFTGTAYSHVYIIMSFIEQETFKLKYNKRAIVLSRGENDSFFRNSLQRIMLDLEGYYMLSKNLKFDNKILEEDFLSVLKKEHSINNLYWLFLTLSKYKWNKLYKKLLITSYSSEELMVFEEIKKTKLILKTFHLTKKTGKAIKLLIFNREELKNKIKDML